jgi:hypothetical protein
MWRHVLCLGGTEILEEDAASILAPILSLVPDSGVCATFRVGRDAVLNMFWLWRQTFWVKPVFGSKAREGLGAGHERGVVPYSCISGDSV